VFAFVNRLSSRLARLLLLAGASALLAACSAFEKDPTSKWDADRLYKEAQEELALSNWQKTRELLEKLESRYPFGRHAQQAQIEIAYTYYKEGESAQAVTAAERFLKLNPNHEKADYVQYLKGLSLFTYEPGFLNNVFNLDPSRRDPKSMREAFDAFKELVQRWPDSRYGEDARNRMVFLVNALAQSEVNVARFYLNRGAYVAAVARAQGAIRDYQNSPSVRDALEILVAAYTGLGLKDLADDSERVLRKNFPDAGPSASK
jgi:outer membrane protein assembly factor BamD